MFKSAKWSKSEGLLMFRGRIYAPKDRDLRCQIIEQHHDTISVKGATKNLSPT
jgi:hypothetical protein